jgi:hypothetical protein
LAVVLGVVMNSAGGFPLRRIAATLLVGLLAGSAGATQSRPLNLEEMTERATTIFSGLCTSVRTEHDRKLGLDVTVATFRVDRAIKGATGHTITVRMPWAGDRAIPAGVPSYTRGDEVVLFLDGESASGMRAPVGLGQGRFRVLTDKQGRKLAINDFGNRNLVRGVSASTRERLAGSLDPEALLDTVDGLLRAHR